MAAYTETSLSAASAAFDHAALRDQFPILRTRVHDQPLVYLDNAASAQKPDCVIEAVSGCYREYNANVHRGAHHLSQVATARYEAAREQVRGFLNAAEAAEIIFTRGTTDSINLVAAAWGRQNLRAGQAIVLSRLEHHSNIVPWQLIAEQTGAKILVADISPEGELDLPQFARLLEQDVALVAIAHVSNALGSVLPVADIIRLAHAAGAKVLLDGAQAAPHLAVDVQALGVDFYAFSGHKVFSPTGIGVLYGRRELLDAMPPWQGGGEMIERVTFEKTTYNELPHKFEAGTPNIAGAIGMGEGIRFVRGLPAEVARHEQALLAYMTQGLQSIPEVRLIGTAADKTAVQSFLLGNAHPFDVSTLLDQQGIAVRSGHHCTQPLMDFYGIPGTVRASLALYNNRVDVDAFLAALRRAARLLA